MSRDLATNRLIYEAYPTPEGFVKSIFSTFKRNPNPIGMPGVRSPIQLPENHRNHPPIRAAEEAAAYCVDQVEGYASETYSEGVGRGRWGGGVCYGATGGMAGAGAAGVHVNPT